MARTDELLAVVYREHSELLAVTCVPTWTQGVFDGTLRLHVASLTRPAERNRVVRHEVLHAQVRSGRFAAPQWFHEGLTIADSESSFRRLLLNSTAETDYTLLTTRLPLAVCPRRLLRRRLTGMFCSFYVGG